MKIKVTLTQFVLSMLVITCVVLVYRGSTKASICTKITKAGQFVKVSEKPVKIRSEDSEQKAISKISYDDVLEDPNIPSKLPKLPLSDFLDKAISKKDFARKAQKKSLDTLESIEFWMSSAPPPNFDNILFKIVKINHKQLSQTLRWTTDGFSNWQTPHKYSDNCDYLMDIVFDSNTPQDDIEQSLIILEAQTSTLIKELDNVSYPLWISEERFNRFIKALNCRLKFVDKSIPKDEITDILIADDRHVFSQLRDVYRAGDNQIANHYSILFSNICTLRDFIEEGKLQQLEIFEKDVYLDFINSLVGFKHELAEVILLTEKLRVAVKQQAQWFNGDPNIIARFEDLERLSFLITTYQTCEIIKDLNSRAQKIEGHCKALSELLNIYGAKIVNKIEQYQNKKFAKFHQTMEEEIDRATKKFSTEMEKVNAELLKE